jgi:hypothetical protein
VTTSSQWIAIAATLPAGTSSDHHDDLIVGVELVGQIAHTACRCRISSDGGRTATATALALTAVAVRAASLTSSTDPDIENVAAIDS